MLNLKIEFSNFEKNCQINLKLNPQILKNFTKINIRSTQFTPLQDTSGGRYHKIGIIGIAIWCLGQGSRLSSVDRYPWMRRPGGICETVEWGGLGRYAKIWQMHKAFTHAAYQLDISMSGGNIVEGSTYSTFAASSNDALYTPESTLWRTRRPLMQHTNLTFRLKGGIDSPFGSL